MLWKSAFSWYTLVILVENIEKNAWLLTALCPVLTLTAAGRFYEVRLRKLAQTSRGRHRIEWNQAAEEIGRDKQGIIRRQRRGRGETGRERKE